MIHRASDAAPDSHAANHCRGTRAVRDDAADHTVALIGTDRPAATHTTQIAKTGRQFRCKRGPRALVQEYYAPHSRDRVWAR